MRTRTRDAVGNRSRIAAATARIVAAGAIPLILGGDDSVPIPVLTGFEGHGPVTVVQIDAHVDWGDVIRGEAQGYGSPMRRIAAMPHVAGMVQIGIRGLGSGEAWQHDDARAWGSRLVTMQDWQRAGADAILAALPAGGRYVFCLDCDGLDPAIFPAVAMPTPGGLGYGDVVTLLAAMAARGAIAGVVIAEYVSERDHADRRCALMVAFIALTATGLILAGG